MASLFLMTRHYNIVVEGVVQGVYFRAGTKQIADLLGLNGFTRNEPDGKVYIEAEGDEDMLVKFIQWCHHGPQKARVSYVSVTEGDIQDYRGFEIRR